MIFTSLLIFISLSIFTSPLTLYLLPDMSPSPALSSSERPHSGRVASEVIFTSLPIFTSLSIFTSLPISTSPLTLHVWIATLLVLITFWIATSLCDSAIEQKETRPRGRVCVCVWTFSREVKLVCPCSVQMQDCHFSSASV